MDSRIFLVPMMLVASAGLMAFAWIGHLKYAEKWTFWAALAASWMIVLPEYLLNVSATRWGQGLYTGAQMATFHLCAGVVCVAMVSAFYLKEPVGMRQWLGFGLMGLAIVLVSGSHEAAPAADPQPTLSAEEEDGTQPG